MPTVNLNMPVLNNGIRNTNFFNGRVLAAEDLTTLQTANAQQHHQLGRVAGEGVAWGLDVTLADNTDPVHPVLHVTSGLALNRKGEAVALATDVDLALVKAADVQNAAAGLFAECAPPQGMIPTNLDCYILTAQPASGLQDFAPMTGALSAGFASSCASRYAVEGIKFALLPLGVTETSDTTTLRGQAVQLYGQLKPLFVQLLGLTGTAASNLETQIAPTLSLFRNVVAHLCFGTDRLQSFPADPFAKTSGISSFNEYGALDALRDQGYLTDCAVPLALVYWTAAGVQFVDLWAVRRPVFPEAASQAWPVFSGTRRTEEGLAMFLQFQKQLDELLDPSSAVTPEMIEGNKFFRYLPPVGVLPIDGIGSSRGVSYLTFFDGNTFRKPQFMEGARIAPLVRDALLYPPVDLTDKVMVWLYWIRENMQAINTGSSVPPNGYIIFASGHTPNYGYPHYDVNRWDYSTYA